MRELRQKIKALISLLDDPEELVFNAANRQLLSIGTDNLDALEDAMEDVETLVQHDRLEKVIYRLKNDLFLDQFSVWIHSEKRILSDGWYLLSSIFRPWSSNEKVDRILNRIINEIWLEFSENLTSIEKTAIINHIFFNLHHFERVDDTESSIDSLFIDNLLFTKKGNDLTLLMMYWIIADRLNFKLYPVNLGRKIMLAYRDDEISKIAFGDKANPYLFFINVSHKGSIVSYQELQFIQKIEAKYSSPEPRILNEISLINLLLQQLKRFYSAEGNKEKLEIIEKLLGFLRSA